jgi:hypothetical protein
MSDPASLPVFADVTHRTVAPQQLATVANRVDLDDVTAFVAEAAGTLAALIRAHGGRVVGPCMVVYHGPVGGGNRGPVEVCVPYSGELTFGEGDGQERPHELNLYMAPARTEAYLTLRADQVNPQVAAEASRLTRAYAEANGDPATYPREFYYPLDGSAEPGQTAAEISWPFDWKNQLRPVSEHRA